MDPPRPDNTFPQRFAMWWIYVYMYIYIYDTVSSSSVDGRISTVGAKLGKNESQATAQLT
eukprot:97967-Karenia_brevis.AAC.1